MLRVVQESIEEKDLGLFINFMNNPRKKIDISEKEMADLVHLVSERANGIIDVILSECIQQIDNVQLRNWFRRFLIAKKYAILIDYQRGTKECYISYADDNCVFVQSPYQLINYKTVIPSYTIVLSPIGKVMIPENTVYLFENTRTRHGFTAKWNGLFGLYDRSGEKILPCIFEDIEHKDYESFIYLKYNGIKYRMGYVADLYIPSVNYHYKDMVLSFSPADIFITDITDENKELFEVLDKSYRRLSEEELQAELRRQNNSSKM